LSVEIFGNGIESWKNDVLLEEKCLIAPGCVLLVRNLKNYFSLWWLYNRSEIYYLFYKVPNLGSVETKIFMVKFLTLKRLKIKVDEKLNL
jgi:hypothetical protein